MYRANILIVDEFVRTDETIINRVFVPMLTAPRTPPYAALTTKERESLPEEPQRQLYLSSIRRADEWSYKKFVQYADAMTDGDKNYLAIALPYQFGVKNRYITKAIVEQQFKDNEDAREMLVAGNILPIYSNVY